MKKLFCLLAITSLFAVSCSSDSDNPDGPDPSSNRLIQEIDTYEDGTSTTYNYTYSGNKLVSVIDSDGETMTVTYTGNQVTKIQYFTGSTLDQSDIYEYNTDGKLVKMLRLDHQMEWGNKFLYVHNADGTISGTESTGDMDTQTFPQSTFTLTMLPNGEVGTMTNNGGYSHIYQYDNKNNPWKNIPGMKEINIADYEAEGANHNLTSMEVTGTPSFMATYTYTYNSNDYPTLSTEDYDGEVITTQYIYE